MVQVEQRLGEGGEEAQRHRVGGALLALFAERAERPFHLGGFFGVGTKLRQERGNDQRETGAPRFQRARLVSVVDPIAEEVREFDQLGRQTGALLSFDGV